MVHGCCVCKSGAVGMSRFLTAVVASEKHKA
jgi:hypothetical protein